jgi:hypothetical protein
MGTLERRHPWLVNAAIGLILGVVAWYFSHRSGAILLMPFIWVPTRVAWLRGGRGGATPSS